MTDSTYDIMQREVGRQMAQTPSADGLILAIMFLCSEIDKLKQEQNQ